MPTIRRAAGAAALAASAFFARTALAGPKPKPPAHSIEGLTRLSADADVLWLAGSHELTLAGIAAVARLEQDADGNLRGTVEIERVIVPVTGRAKRGGGGTSVTLAGDQPLDGEPYASVQMNATVGPKGWKGTAKLRRPTTRKLIPRAAVKGRLRRSATSAFYVNLLATQTVTGEVAGTARVFLPEGTVDLPLAGTSRGGRGGDTVSLSAGAGKDLIRISGRFDGARLRGFVSGKHRHRRLKKRRIDVWVAPEPLKPVSFGTGFQDVTLDASGALPGGATITTDAGAQLVVAPGTRFRTALGEVLRGAVRIGLDDGGGSATWPGLVEPAATFRAFVRQTDGSEFPRAIRFEPAVRVVHQMGDTTGLIGTVSVEAPPGGAGGPGKRGKAGPPDPGASLPEGEVEPDFDDDGELSGVETYVMTDDLRRSIDFENRNATGLVEGDVVHEFVIPGDATSEWPRVYYVDIETVAVGGFSEFLGCVEGYPGLTVGESAAEHHGRYDVSVIGRDGQRIVRVRTRFRNRLRFRVAYCEEGNVPGLVAGAPISDPVPPEDDPEADEGPYDGTLTLIIDGWGEYPDHEKYLRKLEAGLPLDAAIDGDGFDTEAGGRYSAAYRVIGWEGSARQLLGILGVDPSDAEIADRYVLVHEECPPPVAVVSAFDGTKFFVYTLQPFAPLHEIEVGGPARQVVIDATGTRAWGTTQDDRLVLMDLVTGGVLRETTVPGMGPAIDRSPTGGVYVSTNTGALRSHQHWELDSFFDVFSGLPTSFHQSISVSTDGGRAVVAAPQDGRVHHVDLVLNTASGNDTLAGLQSAQYSHDGLFVGVTALPTDRLWFFAPGNPGGGTSIVTGDTPIFCRWSETDRYLVSGDQFGDSLTVYDRSIPGATTLTGIDGAEGLDLFRFADGVDRAVVGGFDGKTLHMLRLDGVGGDDMIQLTYAPGWVDVSGR